MYWFIFSVFSSFVLVLEMGSFCCERGWWVCHGVHKGHERWWGWGENQPVSRSPGRLNVGGGSPESMSAEAGGGGKYILQA